MAKHKRRHNKHHFGGSRKGSTSKGFLEEALGFVGGLIAGKVIDTYVPQAQYNIGNETINLANVGGGAAAVIGGHYAKGTEGKIFTGAGIGMLGYEALAVISNHIPGTGNSTGNNSGKGNAASAYMQSQIYD